MKDLLTPPAGQLHDALVAVREAIDVPNGATVGDEAARARILEHRVRHTLVMLGSILEGQADVGWAVAYQRVRLAEHPPTGYRTWTERVAELDAVKVPS